MGAVKVMEMKKIGFPRSTTRLEVAEILRSYLGSIGVSVTHPLTLTWTQLLLLGPMSLLH